LLLKYADNIPLFKLRPDHTGNPVVGVRIHHSKAFGLDSDWSYISKIENLNNKYICWYNDNLKIQVESAATLTCYIVLFPHIESSVM